MKRVRAEVFTAQVSKALTSFGWRVLPARPDIRARRDLMVQSEGERGPQHHVIPVFTYKPDFELLATPKERLENSELPKWEGSRFIVVPPRSKAAGHRGGIDMVTLDGLLTTIGRGDA